MTKQAREVMAGNNFRKWHVCAYKDKRSSVRMKYRREAAYRETTGHSISSTFWWALRADEISTCFVKDDISYHNVSLWLNGA